MPSAICVNALDNVATLLEDAPPGVVQVVGAGALQSVALSAEVAAGHKVALRTIRDGEPVVKYAVPIGLATTTIQTGEWVHLHNCKSLCDERSSTLDAQTGAPTDTRYA
jgi:hypothetical protein